MYRISTAWWKNLKSIETFYHSIFLTQPHLFIKSFLLKKKVFLFKIELRL